MNQLEKEFQGEQVTFRGLFEKHPLIEIPIIQRDFAQGRASAAEVRTEFLGAIYRALTKENEEQSTPLDLDFVYGSVEETKRKAFLPLDGQQRLTTLFLLHWYLAWVDGKSVDFAGFMTDQETRKARFSYAVRPSSEEFFDSLVNYVPEALPGDNVKLSEVIADQAWFFRSWKLDPTIQSALTMLDAIHEQFASTEGFYDKLLNTERPYITFQLLNLRSPDLSDNLYIKMNARGKPLTPFETFKARLEQKLDELFPVEKLTLHRAQVSVKTYFSHRIDSEWADLFWHYRDGQNHLFDEKIMNLIRAVAIVTRGGERDSDDILEELRDDEVSFSFFKYEEGGCLDRNLLETLIAVLDAWCPGSNGIQTHLRNAAYFDEKAMFEHVMENAAKLTYSELVQFHAYCAYIRKHQDNLEPDAFWEWMRLIVNLAENTNYDRLDDFKRSVRAVNDLLGDSSQILPYLAALSENVSGFDGQQGREERLKAQLIFKNKEWRSLIHDAEQHGFFAGQIEFLFAFSGVLDRWLPSESCTWSEPEDTGYRNAFSEYFKKTSAIFDEKGLKEFGEYRWQRALLSEGDYLLRKNSNFSFLVDRERDASWKRLLRGGYDPADPIVKQRAYVNAVLDQIDAKADIATELQSIIDNATPSAEWRRAIVEKYELIGYCSNRMIRRAGGRIYLLRKFRMSGEHAELFSYYLWIGFLKREFDAGRLAPFTKLGYYPVSTDSEEPCAYLEYPCGDSIIVLDIASTDDGYELCFFSRNRELPKKQKLAIKSIPGFATNGEALIKVVKRSEIEIAIQEVVRALR